MRAKYGVKKGAGGWQVWDLDEGEALASFDTLFDAETCRTACEIVWRNALTQRVPTEGREFDGSEEGRPSDDVLRPDATSMACLTGYFCRTSSANG